VKRLRAYPLYLIMQGGHGFFFSLIVTVNLVYHATVVGLNPFQMVLVGTVLELSVLLLEVPTGVVADVYSRRMSVIIGYILMGLGFVIEGSYPSFAAVLLAQVVWGAGATFLSGASEAWIADEVSHGNQGSEASLGQVYLRANQVSLLGGLLGIGLSVVLASYALSLPIVLGGVLFIGLGLFLLLFMPEEGFTPTPSSERNSWQAMRQTLQDGISLVRLRPVLLTILLISAIIGVNSESFDRLWTPHLLVNFTFPGLGQLQPVAWFGIISAVGMLLTMGASEIARRRVDTDSHQAVVRAMLGITGLFIVGMIFFALTTSFALAIVTLWIIDALRSTLGPLYMAWVNQHVESKVRATVLSMSSQSNAIGQMVGGPAVGAIAVVTSLRVALVVGALLLTPAMALYARTLRPAPEVAVSEA
jgi:DHA3 family tetracycline resistance protein-like MFS transporter